MKSKATLILALFGLLQTVHSATIYQMSVDSDVMFTHTTAMPLADGSAVIGTTGTFAFDSLATDTTANTATFSGTEFQANDWGGNGTFSSIGIDVSEFASVTISGAGTSVFAASTEFFNFFYTLDGGTPINFAPGDEVVDTSGASNLVVGFAFNHNGASDNVQVTNLSVDGVAVPEPSAALLGGLGLLALMRRRR